MSFTGPVRIRNTILNIGGIRRCTIAGSTSRQGYLPLCSKKTRPEVIQFFIVKHFDYLLFTFFASGCAQNSSFVSNKTYEEVMSQQKVNLEGMKHQKSA